MYRACDDGSEACLGPMSIEEEIVFLQYGFEWSGVWFVPVRWVFAAMRRGTRTVTIERCDSTAVRRGVLPSCGRVTLVCCTACGDLAIPLSCLLPLAIAHPSLSLLLLLLAAHPLLRIYSPTYILSFAPSFAHPLPLPRMLSFALSFAPSLAHPPLQLDLYRDTLSSHPFLRTCSPSLLLPFPGKQPLPRASSPSPSTRPVPSHVVFTLPYVKRRGNSKLKGLRTRESTN